MGQIDLSNYEALLVTGSEKRFPFLIGTLWSILSNVTNLRITVVSMYPLTLIESMKDSIRLTQELAERYGNELVVAYCGRDFSLGNVKAIALEKFEKEFVWFIDDDISISYDAMNNFFTRIENIKHDYDYFNFEFVDVNDSRGHKDYDLVVRDITSIGDFINEYGEEKVIHHRWKSSFRRDTKTGGGIFVAKLKTLFDNGSVKEMEAMKKGERGYDVIVASCFERKTSLLGKTVWHCGLDSFIGGDWNKIADKAKALVEDDKDDMVN